MKNEKMKKIVRLFLVFGLVLVFAGSAAAATFELTKSFTDDSGQLSSIGNSIEWTFDISEYADWGDLSLNLSIQAEGVTGTVDALDWTSIYMGSENIGTLGFGDDTITVWLGLATPPGSNSITLTATLEGLGIYSVDGLTITKSTLSGTGTHTPVPASVLLLSSGLAAFFGIRRKS